MRCTLCFLETKSRQKLGFVATDMDGTILSPKHVMSSYTKDTLRVLSQERKVPLIFATGRQHGDVVVVVDHLMRFFDEQAKAEKASLVKTPLFLICSNGAVVHDAWSGRTVATTALPEGLVRELYTLLPRSETRINTHAMQRGHWFCRMNWEEMLQFHQESGFAFEVLPRLPSTPQEKEMGKKTGDAPLLHGDVAEVCQMSFTSWDRPLLESLEQHLQKTYKDQLSITFSASYCVDIAPAGVNKARGLKTVFRELAERRQNKDDDDDDDDCGSDIDKYVQKCLARTVAFGDDLNDAAMLKAVGCGNVMANCNPRLRALCPDLPVVPSNAEDGPAKTLRRLFSIDHD